MELPDYLKNLYRHWPKHVVMDNIPDSVNPCIDEKLYSDISWFIHERISVWKRKIDGSAPPFTDAKILANFRFCNIYREFDKQTIAFHTLLNPIRDDFPLWLLNMFYCRMVANPATTLHTGLLSFSASENEILYEKLMNSPRPRFGVPYVFPISVIQRSPTPTREMFIAYFLPIIMRQMAEEISTWDNMSVYEGMEKLLPIFGYNLKFLWNEVLIDVAYQYPGRIDLFSRFPVGPGSMPTMNRICPDIEPSILVEQLASVPLKTGITYNGKMLRLSAENWEGIGCEFRKYTNLSNGLGRRRLYK